MRQVYGTEYSSTLGQHQLESSYTDWRSKMLYGVFEEIFSRDQKYSHTGTVKQMITGETQRIEKKFMSGWEEANHMNAAFLSNEIQPFPVEPFDRRMLVIWPEGKLSKELVRRVLDELNNGGIEAFYQHLLSLDLQDFTSHTEPPMTEAKERLIDFGRSGWDTFYQEWHKGYLSVPYMSCLIVDLYEAYKAWCHSGHERQISLKKFSDFMSVPSRGKRKRDAIYDKGVSTKKGTFLLVDERPEALTQKAWLGGCVSTFQKALQATDI
jgi:putative DNA primase/helicase